MVNTVEDLAARGVGFKVLTGQGANIDTTTGAGKFVFAVFAGLAEFERELIRERTMAGLASARARGRVGGSQVRPEQSPGADGPIGDGPARDDRCGPLQRAESQSADVVPLRRSRRPVP